MADFIFPAECFHYMYHILKTLRSAHTAYVWVCVDLGTNSD